MASARPRIDYEAMIPEIATYLDGRPGTVDLWLGWIGRYEVAVAYASLFWPEFVEIDGCVLCGTDDPDTRASYAHWKAACPDDPTAIEATLNHVHLGDLFPAASQPNAETLRHLGRTLREMWGAKLKLDFPEREFVVSFDEDFDSDVDDPQITFHTRRD